MDNLELSSDSIDSEKTKKRPRIVDSEDEAIDLPTKKEASFISQMSKNNVEAITDGENNQIQNELLKQENGNQIISLNENNCLMNKTIEGKKENTENKNPSPKAAIDELEREDIGATTESDETLNKEKKRKDETKKKNTFKNRTVDTEVVEGLELSVECASEKDEPSSESENDVKPRPKTIIVKAEPNESELECSLSGRESDSQEATNNMSKTKIEKRKKGSSQTSSNKLKFNESDDSQENNSNEEYSPQTKKMNKLSKRLPKHSVVSKKRQNKDVRRSVRKKNIKHTSDENLEATGENKKEIRVKIETEEEISEKESIISNTESNNNSVDEDVKGKRKRRSNVKPEDHGKIQTLKKYLKVAGIRVKNYNNLWADCNTNVAKINRLKKLLEDNGVIGRPTLEKCKLARQKRERIKEISELDTSNIISEGRITRTRRNVTNTKKMSSDTQYQETRNIFKRIRTVVDSDSE